MSPTAKINITGWITIAITIIVWVFATGGAVWRSNDAYSRVLAVEGRVSVNREKLMAHESWNRAAQDANMQQFQDLKEMLKEMRDDIKDIAK